MLALPATMPHIQEFAVTIPAHHHHVPLLAQHVLMGLSTEVLVAVRQIKFYKIILVLTAQREHLT